MDLACDLHNVPFIGSGKRVGGEMMDSPALRISQGILRVRNSRPFAGCGSQFDARFMSNLAMESSAQWRVMPRFPLQPFISGISGRTQRDYLSASQRTKDTIRGIFRRLAPRLWI